MGRRTVKLSLILLLILLVPPVSMADDQNYQNYQVGDRAAGMGGAYTAISDTPEGTYYNPAGISFAKDSSISLTGTVFRWTKGTITNAVSISTAPGERTTADLPMNTIELIPTSTVFVKTFNLPWWDKEKAEKVNAWAFSLYVPDSNIQDGKIDVVTDAVDAHLSYHLTNRAYLLGPSYSRRIRDNFSMGVSLYYLYRTYRRELFYRYEIATQFSQGYSNDEYGYGGFVSVIGAKVILPHDIHVGLSVQPYSVRIHGGGERYFSSSLTDSSDNSDIRNEYAYNNLHINLQSPMKLTEGIAYHVENKMTIGGDVSFYFPHTFLAVHDSQARFDDIEITQNFTVNSNVGFEYYLWKSWPIRGGFFTNFSSAPALDSEDSNNPMKIDYYGWTAGLGFEQEHSTMSLTGQYTYGDGQLLDAGGNPASFDLSNVTVVLGGSYRF